MILLKHSEHLIPIIGMAKNGGYQHTLTSFRAGSNNSNQTVITSSSRDKIFPLVHTLFPNYPRILPILKRELLQKMTQFNTNKQLRQSQGTSDRQTKILIMNCFSIETNKAVFFHCEPHLCLTELNFSAKISLT